MIVLKDNPLITDLVGEQTTKLDNRIIFFGYCDELSSHIMELKNIINDSDVQNELVSIIMGEIAGGKSKLELNSLNNLVNLIKKYEQNNGVLTEFVLPGQTLLSSKIHITRCVARRTELCYAKVYNEYNSSEIIFEYLNKLSTFFYSLALKYE